MKDLNEKNEEVIKPRIKSGNKTIKGLVLLTKEMLCQNKQDFFKKFFSDLSKEIDDGNFIDLPIKYIKGEFNRDLFEKIINTINDYYILRDKDNDLDLSDVVEKKNLKKLKLELLSNNFNNFLRFFKIYANHIKPMTWVSFLCYSEFLLKMLRQDGFIDDAEFNSYKMRLVDSLMGVRSQVFLKELKKEGYDLNIREIQKFMANKEGFLEDFVNLIFKD